MADHKTITIKATGQLREHIPPDTTLHNVHTVGEAITQLALPASSELMMLVNGRLAHWQTELQDGDVLQLVPAISGGSL